MLSKSIQNILEEKIQCALNNKLADVNKRLFHAVVVEVSCNFILLPLQISFCINA